MYEGTVRHRLKACCPRCKKHLVVQQHHSAEYPESIVQHVKRMLFGQMELVIGKHLEQEHGEFHMAATYYNQPMRYVDTSNNTISNQSFTGSLYIDEPCTYTTSTAEAWNYWTTCDTGSTSSSTVWVIWTSDGTGVYSQRERVDRDVYDRQQRYNAPPEYTYRESDNERVQRQERERVAAEQRAEASRAEKEKEERARQLLREVLTEEQNQELDKKGHFELGVVGGARYRIKKGNAYNVEKLDQQGKVIEKLCFHLPGCHHYDTMVMQKLMLETDEQGAYKFANKQRVANA